MKITDWVDEEPGAVELFRPANEAERDAAIAGVFAQPEAPEITDWVDEVPAKNGPPAASAGGPTAVDRLKQGMADFHIGTGQVANQISQKLGIGDFDLANMRYVPPEEVKARGEILNDAAKDLKAQEGEVGFGSSVLQALGKPTTYIGGPARLAAPLGASLDTFFRSEAGPITLTERTGDAATNAAIARAAVPAFEKVTDAVVKAPGAVWDAGKKLLGSVTPEQADQWAYQYAARKLAKEGVSPEEMTSKALAAKAAGTKETLAEAVESPALLSRAQDITRSAGANARKAQQFYKQRAQQTVPGRIKEEAGRIKLTADEGGPLFEEIVNRYPDKGVVLDEMRDVTLTSGGQGRVPITRQVPGSDLQAVAKPGALDAYMGGYRTPDYSGRNVTRERVVSDGINIGDAATKRSRLRTKETIYDANLNPVRSKQGGVKADDVYERAVGGLRGSFEGTTERKVMESIVDLLEQARRRGNSFADMHRVKSQIGKIYEKFENQDAARAAKGLAGKYYNELSDRLSQIEPEYAVAEKLYRQKLAADRIIGVVKDTNDGSVGTLYNRLFGPEGLREELAEDLGPDTYRGLEALIDSMKRIKQGGFGGSDTAFKAVEKAEYAAEKGSPGAQALSKPSNLYNRTLGKLADDINRYVGEKNEAALMRLIQDPDVERLGKMMARHDRKLTEKTKDYLMASWLKKATLPGRIAGQAGSRATAATISE